MALQDDIVVAGITGLLRSRSTCPPNVGSWVACFQRRGVNEDKVKWASTTDASSPSRGASSRLIERHKLLSDKGLERSGGCVQRRAWLQNPHVT